MNFSLLLGSFIQKEFWRALFWKIHDFLLPKQRWLTRQIPKSYTDVDDLITLCLHACLRKFVEEEDGLLNLHAQINSQIDTDEMSDEANAERQERYRVAVIELSDAYNWLNERDAFMSACLSAGAEAEQYTDDSKRRAALTAYARGCEEYERREQVHLESIVRHYSLLWT